MMEGNIHELVGSLAAPPNLNMGINQINLAGCITRPELMVYMYVQCHPRVAEGKWDTANGIVAQFARHNVNLAAEGFNVNNSNAPTRCYPMYPPAAFHYPPTMHSRAVGYGPGAAGGFRGIIRLSFRDLQNFHDCMWAAQQMGSKVDDASYMSSIDELCMTDVFMVFPNGDVVRYDASN